MKMVKKNNKMLHENIMISQCAITVLSYVFNMLILTSSLLIMVLQCSTLKSQFIIIILLYPIMRSQCWTDIMMLYWVIKPWRCAITLHHGAFTKLDCYNTGPYYIITKLKNCAIIGLSCAFPVLNFDNAFLHGGIVMFIVHAQCWPGLYLFHHHHVLDIIIMSSCDITMSFYTITMATFDLTILVSITILSSQCCIVIS